MWLIDRGSEADRGEAEGESSSSLRELVSSLVSSGATGESEGGGEGGEGEESALWRAMRRGKWGVALELARGAGGRGSSAGGRVSRGRTALVFAVSCGSSEVSRALVEAGRAEVCAQAGSGGRSMEAMSRAVLPELAWTMREAARHRGGGGGHQQQQQSVESDVEMEAEGEAAGWSESMARQEGRASRASMSAHRAQAAERAAGAASDRPREARDRRRIDRRDHDDHDHDDDEDEEQQASQSESESGREEQAVSSAEVVAVMPSREEAQRWRREQQRAWEVAAAHESVWAPSHMSEAALEGGQWAVVSAWRGWSESVMDRRDRERWSRQTLVGVSLQALRGMEQAEAQGVRAAVSGGGQVRVRRDGSVCVGGPGGAVVAVIGSGSGGRSAARRRGGAVVGDVGGGSGSSSSSGPQQQQSDQQQQQRDGTESRARADALDHHQRQLEASWGAGQALRDVWRGREWESESSVSGAMRGLWRASAEGRMSVREARELVEQSVVGRSASDELVRESRGRLRRHWQ
jgi:hypothetical protein